MEEFVQQVAQIKGVLLKPKHSRSSQSQIA